MNNVSGAAVIVCSLKANFLTMQKIDDPWY